MPGRLSYDDTQAAALSTGWTGVSHAADPELDAVVALWDAKVAKSDTNLSVAFSLFSKTIAGRPHFLMVSRWSANIDPQQKPAARPWVTINCDLYDFAASAPIEPAAVNALLGHEYLSGVRSDALTTYVWGPACERPRTGATYLIFVPEGSSQVAKSGFSGLVLKFTTAEPSPGDVVPSTYC